MFLFCRRRLISQRSSLETLEDIEESLMGAMQKFETTGRKKLRLEEKVFNDYLVRLTMEVAGKYGKPGESLPSNRDEWTR